MSKSKFERAWAEMPEGVELDPLAMKTLSDLQFTCRITLDLIEEGQDAGEGIDPKPIRKWLRKWGDPTK